MVLLTLLPAAAGLLPSITHDHITTCIPTIGFVVSTPHLLLSVMLPPPPTFDSNHWKFFENNGVALIFLNI